MLDSCIDSTLFGIQKLQPTLTELKKIRKKIHLNHDACMQAENSLITKGSFYTSLTAKLTSYYYDYIPPAIRSIKDELSMLAPQGFRESPPKISSSNIIGDTVKFMNEHIEEILYNKDIKPKIKDNIISEIIKSNNNKVPPNLINLLLDKQINWRVRQTIADKIGRSEDPMASQDLIRIISSKQDSWGIPDSDDISERQEQEVCKSIARAIRVVGNPEASPYLINIISNEQFNWGIRQEMTFTVGSLRHPTASQDLINPLCNEQIDDRVREGIANALGELGNSEASPYLINIISNERNYWGVRESAAHALGKLKCPEYSLRLVHILSSKPDSWDSWRKDFDVGKSIAKAIRNLENPAVLPDLTKLRKKQMDARVRDEIRATIYSV